MGPWALPREHAPTQWVLSVIWGLLFEGLRVVASKVAWVEPYRSLEKVNILVASPVEVLAAAKGTGSLSFICRTNLATLPWP